MSGPVAAPVRLGVIGAGSIAQQAHLPVLAKMRGVALAALCDNDRVKARALAERFGVPDVFTDIEDLLELDQLDGVVVTTPNHLHEPHVLAALAAGVHVLCERPLAFSPRGVERILAAAEKADRKVVVAHNQRFRADVQALDRFLHGGELGRVTAIRTGAFQPRRAPDGWRFRRREAGGGAFLEHGFALLDLALWLTDFPEPVRVSAHMTRGRAKDAVEDTMLVTLECAGGLTVTVDVSWDYVGSEERWWFELLGSRGSARLAPLRVEKELNGQAVNVTPTGASTRESAFVQSYRAEAAHFVAMLTGEAKYEPPTDQVLLHRIVEAIYRSADEGREIRL